MPDGITGYGVDCVMCPGSFSATADTLEELVKLVQCHIDDMERKRDKHHMDGEYPHTKDEILASKWFKWNVFGLRPFNKLSHTCAKLPPTGPRQSGLSGAGRRRRLRARGREPLAVSSRS